MTLLQIHFFAASFWLGLLAAETVLELHPRSAQQPIVTIHKWIDLLFEGPVVVLLLATGGLLLASNWPAPPLLMLKVGVGLAAILVNFYCFPLVFRRAGTTDEARAQALSRRIKLTGAGIPLVIAAYAIGVAFLRP